MEISSKFDHTEIEKKWYSFWNKNKFFNSEPDDREPFTIVIPPPNVTGLLHMGHMLNNTIQDILIRKARMMGKNACWVPGTDHASIATEAKVVENLKSRGINKSDISREEFLKYAWEWTEEYGGGILDQLKRLGCSCDWNRTKFTLDDDMYESVILAFIDLHKKGYIYRGYRMVNWDPEAETTVSDEEVNYVEEESNLYYLNYSIDGSKDKLIIATTRPETIFGDTAVCVNPKDKRYSKFIGKKAIVPICDRKIPIIADSYVDIEFGTGCLKVTPAHDLNDYNLGNKHKLEIIDIFDPKGRLNEYGLHYKDKDRFDARKEIVEELKKNKILDKSEVYRHNVGRSERTNAIIEPKISRQWFLKMDKISKPAITNVLKNENIKFFPKKFKSTYKYWLENIKDWNISRQLSWGHQIPAFYYGKNSDEYVIAQNKNEAKKILENQKGLKLKDDELTQDEDVLDTWFSSWLWPISVFDGIRNPENKDIKYYYPTQDLVTGPDIIFFWVARMIISGYEFRDEKPFSNVYFTGIVRDKLRRKMSKQLGNSPDAIELIDKYGADSVRVGLMLSSAAGNDLLFDESLCQQGKNFTNKLWNALRLINGWQVDDSKEISEVNSLALKWYENKFNQVLELINNNYNNYRISDVLMSSYRLVWDDYCSWLLESVKPNFGDKIDNETKLKVVSLFENNLKLLHPFMPFLTEEIWHKLGSRNSTDSILIDSTSKRYSLCGARSGCIVSKNHDFLNACLKFALARLSPPTLGLIAASKALDSSSDYIKNVINEYTLRRNLLIEELSKIDDLVFSNPMGAFYSILKLPLNDSEKFSKFLLTDFSHNGQTVMLAPASGFYTSPNLGKDEVRIAFVLNSDKLMKAINIIRLALKEYKD